MIRGQVINYNVSSDDKNGKMKKICDTTKVQLPSLEYSSSTLSGSGIMGEIDFPNIYKPGPMAFTLNQRLDTQDAIMLAEPREHLFEVLWVSDKFDTNNAKIGIDSHKAVIKALPKKYDPGSLEAGNASDGSNEMEAYYYKRVINGETVLEIDKLNYVLKVNGVDYSTKIRSLLG